MSRITTEVNLEATTHEKKKNNEFKIKIQTIAAPPNGRGGTDEVY